MKRSFAVPKDKLNKFFWSWCRGCGKHHICNNFSKMRGIFSHVQKRENRILNWIRERIIFLFGHIYLFYTGLRSLNLLTSSTIHFTKIIHIYILCMQTYQNILYKRIKLILIKINEKMKIKSKWNNLAWESKDIKFVINNLQSKVSSFSYATIQSIKKVIMLLSRQRISWNSSCCIRTFRAREL